MSGTNFVPSPPKTSTAPKNRRRNVIFVVAGIVVLLIMAGGYFVWRGKIEADKRLAAVKSVSEIPQFLPQDWLVKFFHTTDANSQFVRGPGGDPDHDGLTNFQEYVFQTDPTDPDTDHDGKNDGYEVVYVTDPGNVKNQQATSSLTVIDVASSLKKATDNLVSEGLLEPGTLEGVVDFNRPVTVPSIPDSQIKIVSDTSDNSSNYQMQSSQAMLPYSNGKIEGEFNQLFSTTSLDQTKSLKVMLDGVISKLQSLSVPKSKVADHKTNLIFFGAMKKMVEAQEQIIQNPDDVSPWSEIIYQTKILTVASGEESGGPIQ